MLTEWDIYWIYQYDDIKNFIQICLITVVIITLCIAGFWLDSAEKDPEAAKKYSSLLKIYLCIVVILGMIYTLTPTTRASAVRKIAPFLIEGKRVPIEAEALLDEAREGIKELVKEDQWNY